VNGIGNTATGDRALLNNTSGSTNTAYGVDALISNTSGNYNTAIGYWALNDNTSSSYNTATGFDSLVSLVSGYYNMADGAYALGWLGSGNYNMADGAYALEHLTNGDNNIGLGYAAGYNITTGDNNIDIGNEGDSDDTGIIRIGTEGVQTATYLTGTVYADGVALTSDRDAKENFIALNARQVLASVAALPVTQWNYKTDSKDLQHIGPMAQDFQAAFHLSADDKHISVLDEGGVALAAIQGLNQNVEEKETRIEEQAAQIRNLKQQNDSLAQRLNELEATVKQLVAQK
jgi:hypothetical protein